MILRLSSSVAATVIAAGLIAAGGACSSSSSAEPGGTTTTTSTSSGGSSPAISASDCNTRCGDKLEQCGATATQAAQGCSETCSGSISEAQASCLEAKSCDQLEALAAGATIDTLCAKGTSTTSSSSSTTSSGTSGNPTSTIPTSITITATIPSDYESLHTMTDGKIASLFNVAPKPTFDPEPPPGSYPDIFNATDVTLDSPDRTAGACGTSKFSFVLNASQLGVMISGVDTLPATACASFTDHLAKGATLTLKNVTWPNSSVKSTVKIVLK